MALLFFFLAVAAHDVLAGPRYNLWSPSIVDYFNGTSPKDRLDAVVSKTNSESAPLPTMAPATLATKTPISGRITLALSNRNFWSQNSITREILSVHGLWVRKTLSRTIPFSVTDKRIISELEVHWPNLTDVNGNEAFWSHEFNKHGDILSQEDYFKAGIFAFKSPKAVSIRNEFAALARQYHGNSVPVTVVPTAFSTKLKIQCAMSKAKGAWFVKELQLCVVVKNGLFEVEDCPRMTASVIAPSCTQATYVKIS
ncbi:hypothetical protein QR680_010775 [Steinernema hermaphroditum]|uniref:Uncharacterized protein n=1 Tax=Steinernema hermaphroditum TaxID=289476 RepID=A0AA39IQ34_9BILA|nr:hypothetical protein QR680_010775 [Steinernema hermaphroditum]